METIEKHLRHPLDTRESLGQRMHPNPHVLVMRSRMFCSLILSVAVDVTAVRKAESVRSDPERWPSLQALRRLDQREAYSTVGSSNCRYFRSQCVAR